MKPAIKARGRIFLDSLEKRNKRNTAKEFFSQHLSEFLRLTENRVIMVITKRCLEHKY